MSCSPFDLRDYFLKELSDPQQRQQVESHVRTCLACREELDRLSVTEAALFTLRDEEIPQRIAFVSDKIFEPSPWRRRWEAFWGSTARLGFASAAMLSAALVVFALTRPAPVGQVTSLPQSVAPPAVVQTVSQSEIQERIDAGVARAVAAIQDRHASQVAELTTEVRQARQSLLWATDDLEKALKRSQVQKVADGRYGPPAVDGDAR